MEIKIFRNKIICEEPSAESTKEEDKELETRVNKFCNKNNVVNIFRFDSTSIVIVYKETNK